MGNKRFMAGVQEVLAERYELLEVLGRGGMGVVYRARDRVLDRTVAVKVLPLDRAQDPTTVARFEREALAAAQLSHRNIVAVFDFGTDQETRFIVMEYLSGQSLAQRLHERGGLGVADAVDVAAQIAAALAAAHAAGIVHRDIKPANVMIDHQGHVKVLDFGIARVTDGISLTQTATVIGSASYIAPELIHGARADARSDLYALGCVLYELLAGKPPFSGDLAVAVLHQHSSSTPQPLTALNPAVPAALEELVSSMLAKEPADRPQDADAVLGALAAVDGSPAEGVATVRLPPQQEPPDAPTTRMAQRSSQRQEAPTIVMPQRAGASAARGTADSRRRIPGRALAGAGMLVVGLALLIVVLANIGGPSGTPTAHKGRRAPATTAGTHSSTSTAATGTSTAATSSAAQTATTTATSTPESVASAVDALSALAAQDVQAGTMAAPAAHAIAGDAQALSTASQHGESAPAEAGLVKLGRDITSGVQHGQISASAVPALTTAAASLGAAVQRAIGASAATQTTAGPQSGGPHDGGPPPGQAKKHGHFGQNDQ